MPDAATYVHVPDIIATDLGDELVLLDPRDGTMYTLNVTGRAIWLALPGRHAGALAAALADDFAVATAQAEADVAKWLTELLDHSLIERAPPRPAA